MKNLLVFIKTLIFYLFICTRALYCFYERTNSIFFSSARKKIESQTCFSESLLFANRRIVEKKKTRRFNRHCSLVVRAKNRKTGRQKNTVRSKKHNVRVTRECDDLINSTRLAWLRVKRNETWRALWQTWNIAMLISVRNLNRTHEQKNTWSLCIVIRIKPR